MHRWSAQLKKQLMQLRKESLEKNAGLLGFEPWPVQNVFMFYMSAKNAWSV